MQMGEIDFVLEGLSNATLDGSQTGNTQAKSNIPQMTPSLGNSGFTSR